MRDVDAVVVWDKDGKIVMERDNVTPEFVNSVRRHPSNKDNLVLGILGD